MGGLLLCLVRLRRGDPGVGDRSPVVLRRGPVGLRRGPVADGGHVVVGRGLPVLLRRLPFVVGGFTRLFAALFVGNKTKTVLASLLSSFV